MSSFHWTSSRYGISGSTPALTGVISPLHPAHLREEKGIMFPAYTGSGHGRLAFVINTFTTLCHLKRYITETYTSMLLLLILATSFPVYYGIATIACTTPTHE
ncbi:hypothetical protein BV22DRAFT_1046027 [Leucogyrophana mollusca]|uniref:Uncharacterized protein n=1 Tax=Leucogyrophana mollusca TaxID=85980 RepID=A0ACB8BLE1_9AGAM|nr:hypothetical protein BV22DRAFT_1046027 [Leucogyrophana mollusca]